MPQGKTKSLFLIGSPISSELILPLYFLATVNFKTLTKTSLDNPVVYELIIKNNGLSDKIWLQSSTKLNKSFLMS